MVNILTNQNLICKTYNFFDLQDVHHNGTNHVMMHFSTFFTSYMFYIRDIDQCQTFYIIDSISAIGLIILFLTFNFYSVIYLFPILYLRGFLHGGGPALLVGLALVRGLDFTSRFHVTPPTRAGSLSRVTRANYIYFPTKPGVRYLHFISYT